MATDIVDLTGFYETPLGRNVAKRLVREVNHLWPQAAGPRDAVMAYGYGVPVAAGLWAEAEWYFLMPSQQGAPAAAHNTPPNILTHEAAWPVRDESINRLLVLHGLEAANQPERLMQEAWRVLVPNGRAMFIVPNRRGLWARRDRTPFGTGRPFSAWQLRQLMRQSGFVPGAARPALLLPPSLLPKMHAGLPLGEKLLSVVLPHLAGVWVMEAIKQVPAPLSVRRAMQRRKVAAVRPAVVSPSRFVK